uniref:Reverse transcriptase domain-containing protein n=1 Tax=Cannabis sativa TaxID=3483 RepID=A0A803Q2Q8_CANSA
MDNQAWLDHYQNAEGNFLNEGLFDHSPGIFSLYPRWTSEKRPFRYFRMWKSHADYEKNISKVWRKQIAGTKMYQVSEAFVEYYKELLGTRMEGRKRVKHRIITRGPVVNSQQVEMLTQKFTKEEVKQALFDIPGNKAPGSDGFSSFFYQDNWDFVGEDLYEAVTSFVETGKLLKEIKAIVLTLVPKLKFPNTFKDFRPIACCNVLYKIATKLLCSRIKNIFPNLVSQNQGSFIRGRCTEIKLNHLAFADDVLLFCKGDFRSVHYLLQGLKLFSMTSGLSFPIGAKKISGKDCEVLAEKITARIKTWSSRNVSFAGRVVVINSVLMAIHAYWCQVLILPKKVVNAIEAICMNYLWNGKAVYQGLGAISWESICQPQSTGGISFKNVATWNKVAMGKYVWAIELHTKLESLVELKICSYLSFQFNQMDWESKCLRNNKDQKVMAAAIASLAYSIWRMRNKCQWNNKEPDPVKMFKELKLGVTQMIELFGPKKISEKDRQ